MDVLEHILYQQFVLFLRPVYMVQLCYMRFVAWKRKHFYSMQKVAQLLMIHREILVAYCVACNNMYPVSKPLHAYGLSVSLSQ